MGTRRTWLFGYAAFHALALAAAVGLGASYPERMNAPGGFHLVEVADAGARAPFARPAHAVVALIDGLGIEEARTMRTAQRLGARGRCFEMAVGSPSISRPMYAVLSSGVEQDRTGVRSNVGSAPAAVDSVWERARAAGWHVRVVSAIDWWNSLFPRGFDEHVSLDDRASSLAMIDPRAVGNLDLVHELYVDGAGHEHGAVSPEYAAAVARADAELGRLLDATDLETSLFVLTADHGHARRGGHGGLEPRVATVLTCFAGMNVQPAPGLGAWRATAFAPALALLTGVPFPRHMRAGEHDDLDAAIALVAAEPGNAAYLADRRAMVARFRAAAPAWDSLYVRARTAELLRAVGLAVVAALAFGIAFNASSRRARIVAALTTVGLMVVAVVVDRGSFDLSAVNHKPTFIRHVAALSFAIGLTAALTFARRRADPADALRLLTTVGVVLLGATLGHAFVYGFHVGFPLPPPSLLFLPLFSTIALGATALLGLLVCAWLAVRRAR